MMLTASVQLLCVIYGLNYLDSMSNGSHGQRLDKLIETLETTLSYASIMGIRTDIGLKGDNYQWLGSMFYFGMKTHYPRLDMD